MNKREVRQAAARLRALGKVVPIGRSDAERLQELQQAARNQDTYEEATVCPACTAEQERSGDRTTLCANHLSRALGF